MDTIIYGLICFAFGVLAGWITHVIVKEKPDIKAVKTNPAEPDELPPGVVPMDAVPELRKQPKTTANVRKLQSHRAALLEFCEQHGLKVEALDLLENLDMEMEAQ